MSLLPVHLLIHAESQIHLTEKTEPGTGEIEFRMRLPISFKIRWGS